MRRALPTAARTTALLASMLVGLSAASSGGAQLQVADRLPPACQTAQTRAKELRAELEARVAAEMKAAVDKYAAKPGPGISSEKARSDFAAGAALDGDVTTAAWLALGSLERDWNAEELTSAGVYLFYVDKAAESLQMLTCAHAMGARSAFLFEAIATVQQKAGRIAEARQAIEQAKQMAPDDRLIEVEASLLTTGQPPPPDPPERQTDGLDAALRELAEHIAASLRRMKADTDIVERSLPGGGAKDQFAVHETHFRSMLQMFGEQIRAARAIEPRAREAMVNSLLASLISAYAQVTDALLSVPGWSTSGVPLLFWADTLSLDPPVLARESRREAIIWDMHSALGPALAQGANDDYTKSKEQAYGEYVARERACGDSGCIVREVVRWCGIWKGFYDTWGASSRIRHNRAARTFDRVATRTIIEAENALLQTRAYAVRQVATMKFTPVPGFDVRAMTLDGLNQSLARLFEKHLQGGVAFGTVDIVKRRAEWFTEERAGMEGAFASEGASIKAQCEPAIAAYLELLAQEEWQEYLAHLRDRAGWGIEAQGEPSEFPCDASVGPLTIGTDLNRPAEGKMDVKWSRKGVPVNVTGSAKIRDDQTVGVGISVGVRNSWNRETQADGSRGAADSAGGTGTYDPLSGVSPGGSGCYGPFCGKAKATVTTKVSPWNSREYLGIKLKGSAGLGLRTPSLGAGGKEVTGAGFSCYPSSGSVTFYPRALFDDAVKYLSTPSERPR